MSPKRKQYRAISLGIDVWRRERLRQSADSLAAMGLGGVE